ncbi:hypothetical protein HYDPIDRAFT_116411 [Hydnomerulius pinastri MD-312]|uniref:Uncharacterized protein n=1 Tax=Hydnomerulius pinastri MD-312 TaxID=994086 RepID=A0A0C9W456_9AGAM|nr:hypothetical protein HYDPIDRAFT_116411 [Hydnomerulius pinastri MD-312]
MNKREENKQLINTRSLTSLHNACTRPLIRRMASNHPRELPPPPRGPHLPHTKARSWGLNRGIRG